jgi:hypothetical protein
MCHAVLQMPAQEQETDTQSGMGEVFLDALAQHITYDVRPRT